MDHPTWAFQCPQDPTVQPRQSGRVKGRIQHNLPMDKVLQVILVPSPHLGHHLMINQPKAAVEGEVAEVQQ